MTNDNKFDILHSIYINSLEQDKSSDIEQKPPFGDRKYTASNKGELQNQREQCNFDKVWNSAPDGRFGK